MQVQYPVEIVNGRLLSAATDAHIRQMIEQVLFTMTGERVNRLDFGCGVDLLVFEPGNTEIVAATQSMIRAALMKWLGDVIVVENATVAAAGATLTVTIQYTVLRTNERRTETYSQ